MIPSSILLANEGVAAVILKVPQVLYAAFIESLTGWIVGLLAIVAGAILVGLLRLLHGTRRIDCEIGKAPCCCVMATSASIVWP